MIASKAIGKPPREVAQGIVEQIGQNDLIDSCEVAGPGFINVRLNPKRVATFVGEVIGLGPQGLASGGRHARSETSGLSPKRINVEFVSVNPNGPITVGSGRGAAFGSVLCNVLEAAGHSVHREYYVNDGVNSEQMRLFAESVRAHALGLPLPERGYMGDYVAEVASKIPKEVLEDIGSTQDASQALMLDRQRQDLGTFGVNFDTWFSEQSLHDSGAVSNCISELIAKGAADEEPIRRKVKLAKGGLVDDVEVEQQAGMVDEEGELSEASDDTSSLTNPSRTLWLRSTKFGDDMDRVLRRQDGRLTYIASDVAYHKDKFSRGSKPVDGKIEPADKLITVLGPDHHGYIGRLHAVVAALLERGTPKSSDSATSQPLSEVEAKLYRSPEEREACRAALAESKERLEVVIFQIVRFVKDGKPVLMRKRDGNIYTLRDLMSEIGKTAAPKESPEEQIRIGRDVARFFYLMRSHDTHMDFDIDLATKQSDENPVFYCQYAHARICSVLRKASESGLEYDKDSVDLTLLIHPKETALIKKICELPNEVQRCAEDYGVHRLTTFAVELARTYHHFYDACRVVNVEDPALSLARIALCKATKVALGAVFGLIGISSPEVMLRSDEHSPVQA